MNVAQVVDRLKEDARFRRNLTAWHTVPAQPARYAGFPEKLAPRLVTALQQRGIHDLYTHQREAVDAVLAGENVCVVTPTASGKTLCYNLPVLNRLLGNPQARALYLFPTKALSQDQMHEVQSTVEDLDVEIGVYTFDGDTPQSARKAIRKAGHIVVTNPDMLHTGILPHHTIWLRLFENLEFVVVDEVHHYRGVFGSHLANVLRRLKRICAFYGSNPQFICCSATINNPKEMAERIIETPVRLIDNNGAPSGERHFLFYNPPVVNAELGIRKSSVKEAVRRLGKSHDLVKGYRGGYLPTERRAIEKGLRDGDIMAVVSTNALELGIDIGSLDVCIMTGYSGSVASTWQQAGRAGRRSSVSLVVLVATSAPLDQFIINHPEYFFGLPPESGTVDSNNLIIVASHLKCAVFELPFEDGEAFGLDAASTRELLEYLEENRIVRHVKNRWHWSADKYPAEDISLRTAAPGNVVILDTSDKGRVIGEVDYFSAPVEVYENAIYLHQSAQYTIESLDLEDRKAYARPVEVDYYTDAELKVDLNVLTCDREEAAGAVTKHCGEVSVTWLPTIYKKIKFGTHENVGWGKINLPESTMHTASYWLEFPENVGDLCELPQKELGESLNALANALRQVCPVQVLCDPSDIRAQAMLRAPFSGNPTVYLYETYPGGVGFSEKIFTHHGRLIEAALSLMLECTCKEGCPSCVGPTLEVGECGKSGAVKLARLAIGAPDKGPGAT